MCCIHQYSSKSKEPVTTQTANPSLEKRIAEVISWTLHLPASQLHPHTHLRDDLFLDPVDLLLLIAKLEYSFNVYLSPEEAEAIATVQDLYACIRRRLG